MKSVTAMPPVEGAATPIILAGALTLGLVVQFALPATSFPPTPVRAARSGRLGMAPSPSPSPLASFSAIVLRPLFSPDRSSVATSAGEPAAPVGVFALMGAASAGARASAVLRAPDGGVHALRLGESLDGWRLTSVGAQGVVLSRGGVSQSLKVGAPPTAPLTRPGGALQAQGVASLAMIR